MAGVGLLTCPNEVLDQIMAYVCSTYCSAYMKGRLTIDSFSEIPISGPCALSLE